jgi:hypothetical protein
VDAGVVPLVLKLVRRAVTPGMMDVPGTLIDPKVRDLTLPPNPNS